MAALQVATFYRFADLPDFAALRGPLRAVAEAHGVKGTVLLAAEGVNGTLAGSPAGLGAVLDHLRDDPRLAGLEARLSDAEAMPFARLKVKLKREIVTLGVPGLDPAAQAGAYVAPADWNALIARDDVVLIDARNDYEVAIGTFEGAVDPETAHFRDLPGWLRQQEALRDKPPVAMFCTGGIRCEKATALLRAEGFDEVYHLQGGILHYLESVPEAESTWQGACFVFDERVAVEHGLTPTDHVMCTACGDPVSPEVQASPAYVPGVQCPRCADG